MNRIKLIVTLLGLSTSFITIAQDHRHALINPTKPGDTEYWDPEVRIVTPGSIPSDAIVLFDGKNLDKWESIKDGGPAQWKVEDGKMTVVRGAGHISTKQKFTNYQLHIE